MKALRYSVTNELAEYDRVSNSKRRPTKTVLIRLMPRVDASYQQYLKRFSFIHQISANPFNPTHSAHLRKCYHNSTAALEDLKLRLITAQSDTFKSLCPYCLISNHSTFDHYIPIEEQPVYGVLAKNIIPCCDVCNKKKLQYWIQGSMRSIIHYYCDSVPNRRFLFCDLTFNGSIPVLSYRLSLGSINYAQRTRIKRHFDRLDLVTRYDQEVPALLSDINTDISSLGALKPSRPDIARFLLAKGRDLRSKGGANYWRACAYYVLGRSQTYLSSL